MTTRSIIQETSQLNYAGYAVKNNKLINLMFRNNISINNSTTGPLSRKSGGHGGRGGGARKKREKATKKSPKRHEKTPDGIIREERNTGAGGVRPGPVD
jgi:hypothetical protein